MTEVSPSRELAYTLGQLDSKVDLLLRMVSSNEERSRDDLSTLNKRITVLERGRAQLSGVFAAMGAVGTAVGFISEFLLSHFFNGFSNK